MEWTPLMIDNGIPAGPINSLDDVFNDPQVQACGIVQSVDHPTVGEIRQVGLPVNFSNMEGAPNVRTAPPLFGEHTASVLADYGFEADEIKPLVAGKIVHPAWGET